MVVAPGCAAEVAAAALEVGVSEVALERAVAAVQAVAQPVAVRPEKASAGRVEP